jgi:hypothetical protein
MEPAKTGPSVITREQQTDLIIVKLDRAVLLLAEAKTAQDAKQVVDIAHAAKVYAQRQKLGREAVGYAYSIEVYSLHKLGQMLKATPRNTGAKGSKVTGTKRVPVKDSTPTLAELGLDKKTSSLAKKVADLTDDEVAKMAAGVETITASRTAHVSNNAGNSEWYTPLPIIQAAQRTR